MLLLSVAELGSVQGYQKGPKNGHDLFRGVRARTFFVSFRRYYEFQVHSVMTSLRVRAHHIKTVVLGCEKDLCITLYFSVELCLTIAISAFKY